MEKPSLFVFRPVAKESLRSISRAQRLITSTGSGEAVETPHMTLLGGRYLEAHAKQKKNGALDNIVWPVPAVSKRPITLPTGQLKIVGNPVRGLKYIVELEDPEEEYKVERALYVERAVGHLGIQSYVLLKNPHVTLGQIQSEYATDSLAEAISERLPDTISFEPTEAPSYIEHPPERLVVPDRIIPPPAVTLRRLGGTGIPAGMLNYLRMSQEQKES